MTVSVTGTLPELSCDHDQLTCALQTITCQCVVAGTVQEIIWKVGSEFIGQVNYVGETLFSNANYPTTVEVLENGLSSNVSIPAELKSDPVTVECSDFNGQSNTWSYPIFGLVFEICIFIIELSSNCIFSL